MKKQIHFSFLGTLFSLLLIPSSYSQMTEVSFDFSTAQEINSKLGGFNSGPMFNEIFESSPTMVTMIDRCAILPPPFDEFNDFKIVSFTPQPNLVEKSAVLKPSTMRFPGGTIANYYHLYEYTDEIYDPASPVFAAGNGTQDVETSVFGGSNVIRDQYCKKDVRVQLDDESANPNFIHGFKNYVLAVEDEVHSTGDTDYKMDVIYVANVLTHFKTTFLFSTLKEEHLTPSDPSDVLNISDPTAIFELYYKETIDAIDYLIENDVNVVGIEFGNELFFPVYQGGNNNVTPETYMELCDIYAQRIKVDYPEMKFAILSEPSSPAWNTAVSDYTPVFYDAVILHDYYNKNTCITSDSPCPDGCPDDYVMDRTCRFDCGKCALGDFVRDELQPEFSDALSYFPADTKLWFTEWGIVSPGTYTGNNLDYMNTFLYSCFTMEHLLQQLEFNSLENDRLEYSTHHRIGYKNRWSVVQTRLGQDTSINQSNYYTFKFLEKLYSATESYSYDGLIVYELEDTNSYTVNSFMIKETEDQLKVLVYYTNKSTEDIPFSKTGSIGLFEGEEYLVNNTGKISYLKAADSTGLYSSFGKTKFNGTWIDNTDAPSLLVIEDETFEFGFYTLPALSTGVLEITLDKVVGINENTSSNGIRMYPNPASNQVQLFVPQEINISSISIYSISGELIKNIEVEKEEDMNIDISNFHNGVYMVKINHQDGESILKLIKNK